MDHLSFELHFDADLAESSAVERLQDTLRDHGPTFSSKLRVLEYEGDRQPVAIDVSDPGGLRRAVVDKGSRRGPTFEALAKDDPPMSSRRFGSVLLRGKARSTFLTVRFDEHTPGMRMGDVWLFSNGIGGSVGAPTIDRQPRADWVVSIATALADDPTFLWGAAFETEEFRARNLDETGGSRAMGRDIRRSLPGLYWLNLFGAPYLDLIGIDVVRGSPALSVTEGRNAVALHLYQAPSDWAADDDRARREAVLDHLGREHFFDRSDPDRAARAPDFGL